MGWAQQWEDSIGSTTASQLPCSQGLPGAMGTQQEIQAFLMAADPQGGSLVSCLKGTMALVLAGEGRGGSAQNRGPEGTAQAEPSPTRRERTTRRQGLPGARVLQGWRGPLTCCAGAETGDSQAIRWRPGRGGPGRGEECRAGLFIRPESSEVSEGHV